MMFADFEKHNTKSENVAANYTTDLLLFNQKLKAIAQELDYAIGAQIAKLILEQFDIRR